MGGAAGNETQIDLCHTLIIYCSYYYRHVTYVCTLSMLVCSWPLVVLGVKDNSLLCIITVDHHQPQRWDEKLALALVRSLA